MSQVPPKPVPRPQRPVQSVPLPPPKRWRWRRWLTGLFILFLLLAVFLPDIITLPWVRQKLLDRTLEAAGAKATVGGLSLSWFSPVSVNEFQLQTDESGHNAVGVKNIKSDASLVNLIFRHDVGGFRIEQPVLYVAFDKDGNNLSRLLKALGGSSWGNRAARLDIVDGSLLLRGPNSALPWKIDKLTLNVTMTPPSDNPEGVPFLHGDHAQLLNDAALTPEMCDDLIKFVVPPLANATRTSGRVSLELGQFNWPLGKPNAAELNGKLTLQSVESGPGELIKSLGALFKFASLPATVQITKDDVVAFSMHDGRVYHENLVFSLPVIEQGLLVRSRGSVGLDESLDLFVEITLPDSADLTAHPGLNLLRQTHPTVHIRGTLSAPLPSLEASPTATMAIQGLVDFLQRRAERKEQEGRAPLLPGVLPGRRRNETPPATPTPSRDQPNR